MSDDTSMMPIAATRQEVADQPDVITRVLNDLAPQIKTLATEMAERGINQVLASGSGDSWFAAQAVQLAWERYAGVPFVPLQAYEYAAYGRPGVDEKTAHFVISSSGRPTTTWDTLELALASGAMVIGVTDNPATDNPFVAKPPHALIPKGSKVGWPAQTTSATIATLLALAIAFGKANGHLDATAASELNAELASLPDKMRTVLSDGQAWAERITPSLKGVRSYVFVGGGPSFAVAQNGSALLAEGPQEVGMPLTVEEFNHALRIGAIKQDEPVILIACETATDARCRDTARVVRAWGARLLPICSGSLSDLVDGDDGLKVPAVSEPMNSLITLLPLQLLSIELAAQKVAGGYDRPKSVPA